MPRAGFPRCKVPRLDVYPSVHEEKPATKASNCNINTTSHGSHTTAKKILPLLPSDQIHLPSDGMPYLDLYMQAGEASFGITNLNYCEGKSYSRTFHVHHNTTIRDVQCSRRHQSLLEGDKNVIYVMTCTPLTAPEDLKVCIKDRIAKLCLLA